MTKELPFKSILVWGEPGSGKTLFGWNSPYKPVLCMDFEYSSRPYRRVADQYDVNVVDILKYSGKEGFAELITKVPDGKYGTIVLDTAWQPFEWITQATFYKAGKRAESQSMLVWGDVRRAIRDTILGLAQKCEVLIMTAHARNRYGTKEREPRISPSAFELVDVAIRLHRDPNKKVPVGVVDSRNRLMGLLPPKIEPCTWQKILEYVINPPDWDNLKPEEINEDMMYVPSEDEIAELA